jgi:drug/metabolite transporter (DMT)-like permease
MNDNAAVNRLLSMLAKQPVWRLVFGASLVSFAPILVRATSVPPTTSAFYRMLLGGLALTLYALLSRRSMLVKRRVAVGLMLAGFAFAFDLFFWHRSIHIVGPGLATLLAGFQVFVMAITGLLFFGEQLRWQLVIAIPAAFLGVALIIGFDWGGLDATYRLGVIFGLSTAICYSTVLLLMRWTQSNTAKSSVPISEVAWMSLACAALLCAIALINKESLTIPDMREGSLLIAYASIAQIGWVVIVSGLHRVPIALAGLVLLMEPTLAYVWDILIFARPTTALQAFGALVAIGAIYLGSKSSK